MHGNFSLLLCKEYLIYLQMSGQETGATLGVLNRSVFNIGDWSLYNSCWVGNRDQKVLLCFRKSGNAEITRKLIQVSVSSRRCPKAPRENHIHCLLKATFLAPQLLLENWIFSSISEISKGLFLAGSQWSLLARESGKCSFQASSPWSSRIT